MDNFNSIFQSMILFDSPDRYIPEVEDSEQRDKEKVKRELGRWNVQESQRYLEVIKECDEKDVIRELRKAIPNRLESQIRAHHSKMMKKYGSIQRIIEVSNRKQNKMLMQISKKLNNCAVKIKEAEKYFDEKLSESKQQSMI